jgi:hypothetical protein
MFSNCTVLCVPRIRVENNIHADTGIQVFLIGQMSILCYQSLCYENFKIKYRSIGITIPVSL